MSKIKKGSMYALCSLVLGSGIFYLDVPAVFGGSIVHAEVEDIDLDTIFEGGDSIQLSELDETKNREVLADGSIVETVSYNEMVNNIATDQDITLEEAREIAGNQSLLRASPYSYKHILKSLDVAFSYKPQLDIYVQMWSQGSFRQFNKVVDFNLNRSYLGTSKQFSGKTSVKFINKNNIYWVINGDFYNNGLTTMSGGGSVPLAKQGNLNFTISKASNHYKYFYKYGHVYAQ